MAQLVEAFKTNVIINFGAMTFINENVRRTKKDMSNQIITVYYSVVMHVKILKQKRQQHQLQW